MVNLGSIFTFFGNATSYKKSQEKYKIFKVKTQSKEPPKSMESRHCFKFHFCIFERSQGKHNSLDCHNFFEYFPLISNFICLNLDTNQKKNCMFKAIKP